MKTSSRGLPSGEGSLKDLKVSEDPSSRPGLLAVCVGKWIDLSPSFLLYLTSVPNRELL